MIKCNISYIFCLTLLSFALVCKAEETKIFTLTPNQKSKIGDKVFVELEYSVIGNNKLTSKNGKTFIDTDENSTILLEYFVEVLNIDEQGHATEMRIEFQKSMDTEGEGKPRYMYFVLNEPYLYKDIEGNKKYLFRNEEVTAPIKVNIFNQLIEPSINKMKTISSIQLKVGEGKKVENKYVSNNENINKKNGIISHSAKVQLLAFDSNDGLKNEQILIRETSKFSQLQTGVDKKRTLDLNVIFDTLVDLDSNEVVLTKEIKKETTTSIGVFPNFSSTEMLTEVDVVTFTTKINYKRVQ